MSKIPHYMAELKEKDMDNSTFLCKFICVQPAIHRFCTILQAMYNFPVFHRSFLIHFSYLNLSYDE